jgi:hypothetical protein
LGMLVLLLLGVLKMFVGVSLGCWCCWGVVGGVEDVCWAVVGGVEDVCWGVVGVLVLLGCCWGGVEDVCWAVVGSVEDVCWGVVGVLVLFGVLKLFVGVLGVVEGVGVVEGC